jgi:hypothetical protein
MKQDPNPPDDVELERFCEWLWQWRNPDNPSPGDPDKWRAFIKESDLRSIWLHGEAQWHVSQMKSGQLPADLYAWHSAQWRRVLDDLGKQSDFQPTSAMR